MEELEELSEKTPVKHVRDGYKGWICGRTRMKECFTGNTDCDFQYRVQIPGEDRRRIAPREDLEIIREAGDFPEVIYEHDQHDENESWLHALGYQITGMDFNERITILMNIAIPMRGERSVVYKLTGFMKARATSQDRTQQYYHALSEWNRDINFIMKKFDDKWIKTHVKSIRKKLEQNGYHWIEDEEVKDQSA
ncbi:MAG: hypothetical protein H6756_00340 [Candidatus Omnitrophica bacterium]|nr:hypothetical protein [Candidatus Omnitrophota bacterium]MCB9719302.1 hypothetical protein [Candidatus Omnitrophota bacterium]